MKPIKIVYLIACGLFASILILKATNFAPKSVQSQKEIPDSTKFFLYDIQNTYNLRNTDFPNLISFTKNQCNIWLKPFYMKEFNKTPHDKVYSLIKLISYQKKHNNFYSIIVMLDDEISEFYVLTISNEGIFIDGTNVCSLKNLSNDEITKDTTDNSFIYSTEINTEFKGDSLIKIKKLSKSFNPDSHEEQEFWEETYKSVFIIDSLGKISNITPYFKTK